MLPTKSVSNNILIVNDNVNERTLLAGVLSKTGNYKVDGAGNTATALELLASPGYLCDLLITDIQFSGTDSDEFIKKALAARVNLLVIILTDYSDDTHIVKCLKLGAAAYLTKPVDEAKIAKMVKTVLDRREYFFPNTSDDLEISNPADGWIELTAPSDLKYVERFKNFALCIGDLPLADEDKRAILTALGEIGANAIEWGNRGDRNKKIHLSYIVFPDSLVIKIEDEGSGFDPSALRDPSLDPLAHIKKRQEEGKRPGGYGIYIVRKIMDEVIFSNSGNVVLLTKRFQSS